ncbi:MAG: hypothetical protein LBD11_02115 [Candidatus Peribacteria bacterium]|jgi:hypothetical protein|nr:hypothetical protein [Candidatus Peribacteria bacterium]
MKTKKVQADEEILCKLREIDKCHLTKDVQIITSCGRVIMAMMMISLIFCFISDKIATIIFGLAICGLIVMGILLLLSHIDYKRQYKPFGGGCGPVADWELNVSLKNLERVSQEEKEFEKTMKQQIQERKAKRKTDEKKFFEELDRIQKQKLAEFAL